MVDSAGTPRERHPLSPEPCELFSDQEYEIKECSFVILPGLVWEYLTTHGAISAARIKARTQDLF